MTNGWSHNFDLDSVPEEVMWSIRYNIKKWDDAARAWREEGLSKLREEVERLEAEHNELVSSDRICAVPVPQYVKCIFCLCMNGGGRTERRMTKPLDKLIYDYKTRRQQKGMPDRWRLLERLDPCQFVILRSQDGNVKYSSAILVRRSEVEKLKEEYGESMEVLW